MLLPFFPSNFIFLLAQTHWFLFPIQGKGTALASIRDTSQSQVSLCYSRNQSRVTAQHGEVTLKISMCWFDSNCSSSESCSPFKFFTFFHLKDLLSTCLSQLLLYRVVKAGSRKWFWQNRTVQNFWTDFSWISQIKAYSSHELQHSQTTFNEKSVLTIYGLLWRFFYNTSITTWIRRPWKKPDILGLAYWAHSQKQNLPQRLKSSREQRLLYSTPIYCFVATLSEQLVSSLPPIDM